MLITNRNTQQIFLGENIYETRSYTNSTGSSVTLAAGTLMGTILATSKMKPHLSSSTDGSEQPTGVLAQSYTVADGATATIDIVTKGDVNKNAITLGAGDSWTTPVRTVSTGGGNIQDLVRRNTDITLIEGTEVSAYDNQ